MSFLNPLFLFALLTVAVPLIIYLLNIRKPKKVKFSTLAFFDSLKTTALKRIRIKRWLLLAIRCLAIIALVLAVSRPFLPPDAGWSGSEGSKAIGILIDNSPSMNRVDQNGPYFEQSLELADEIINMAGEEDRILINTTNGSSLNNPLTGKRGAKGRISNLEVVNAGNYLDERLMELQDRLGEAREPNKIIYLITDAQESQLLPVSNIEPDNENYNVAIQIIQVGNAELSNAGFNNVELQSTGSGSSGNMLIKAELVNFGDRPTGNLFLNLIIDEELTSQQPFELGAGETRDISFELPTTEQNFMPVKLLIEGDELAFDNEYYAAVKYPETRNVLVIEPAGQGGAFPSYLNPIMNVIAGDERFDVDFRSFSELELNQIPNYQAIIINGLANTPDYLSQALTDHVQEGAGLLFLPASDGALPDYNRLLGASGIRYSGVEGSYGSFDPIDRMAPPAEGHPVMETIFNKQEDEEIRLNVPEIFYYLIIGTPDGDFASTILETRTGRPLMIESRLGDGNVIVSALGSDGGWSNFPVKPFFAPLIYRTVEYLAGTEGAELNNHTLGQNFSVLLEGDRGGTPEINMHDGIIVPEVRQTFRGNELLYSAREWTPGFFTVSDGNQSILFSANQNTMESRLYSLDQTEIRTLFADAFQNTGVFNREQSFEDTITELESASFGWEIWHWFIIIAIIFILLESIISRYYTVETKS
ncbi:MAG: BatA domain-containing protein [Balneolaceae bacterium]